MTTHCVDMGHDLSLAEANNILNHANSGTARLFKELWFINKNSNNKCIELPHAYLVL